MKALRGIWESCNLFITTKGERIEVYPFRELDEEFRPRWPLKCFMLIDKDRGIYGVVEDEYEN